MSENKEFHKDVLEFTIELANHPRYKEGEIGEAVKLIAERAFKQCFIDLTDLSEAEWRALNVNKSKLEAVKLCRNRVGCSLMEAKKIVEDRMQTVLGFTHFRY